MSRSILFLEDDIPSLGVDFLFLQKRLDAQIVPAVTIQDALRRMETQHFDLFVLDIEIMGEGSTGAQLAALIRRDPSYAVTPILFISAHRHLSQWLFSSVRCCTFLPKPFSKEALLAEMGLALGIEEFARRQYAPPMLLIVGMNGTAIEVDPLTVCYIEVTGRELRVQYTNGDVQRLPRGNSFRSVLKQAASERIPYLRQVYRSILINVNCLRAVEINKNHAQLYLFNVPHPLPLGMKYRDNLRDFL